MKLQKYPCNLLLLFSSLYPDKREVEFSTPELVRWNFVVYESFSMEDDVVLFAKGFAGAQQVHIDPPLTSSTCHTGNSNGEKLFESNPNIMKKRQLVAPTSESNLKRIKKEDKGIKKKKEGRRVEKETNVDIIKSLNLLEDDHDGEGSDIDSPISNVAGSLQQNSDDNDSGLIEGSETEEDNEFSHSDQEDIRTNGGATSEDSVDLSSFDLHLQHNLSKEEIDNQKNLKFSWDVPVIGVSNCTWRGTGQNILKDFNINSCPGLKEKLYEHWMDVSKTSGGKDINSPKQKMFFSLCSSYRDILHCNKRPFYLKGLEDTSIMDAYIMHSLNHVFKTRDCVKKNDSKLARLDECADIERFRDQGFTRPKVLILLPFANVAYRVVKRLIQLTPLAYKVNVEHMDRFSAKFGGEEDKGDKENGEELENAYPQVSSKPYDHNLLLGGNNEDDFMIGIKFTRKTVKLFSDFHTSDFIIASPLCLLNKIEETECNKEKDVDFLSSIEVLIIDHADVMAMQNWSHVHTVIEHLNRLPSTLPRTDVMRIRRWYLDEQARFYRQTIILGFYSNPDINTSFNQQCSNYEGKVKLKCKYKGVMQKVLPKIQQVYVRFNVKSIVDADDERFNYFVTKVFPRINDSDQGGTMIFASSYLEFIRIRNFLKSQNASFCLFGEYMAKKDIFSARRLFTEGKRKIMLCTERAHFYHRFKNVCDSRG
ncbi:U3 small nucleolar RNA-associated-like protein [Medicago truncatula]|uniref:U3 small nucleolar RNA-associated-like protein n=1 Tax=Medicago truncatula TaxID=3880 RepID=G7ILH5_MEDTR|nr:U3 small nucleolar RNA-associated-like protein [Medicago truncatula]